MRAASISRCFPELNLSSYAVDDLFLQEAFLDAVEQGLARLAKESAELRTVLVVGAPLRRNGRLYNCGVVLARGVDPRRRAEDLSCPITANIMRSAGSPPASAPEGHQGRRWPGRTSPFGTDLIFAADDLADFIFHVEICEDFWAPLPPSTLGALAGALILTNLSRLQHHDRQGGRAQIALRQPRPTAATPLMSSPPPGRARAPPTSPGTGRARSTKLGELLAETGRFDWDAELAVADIDVQRLRLERMRNGTFNDNARLPAIRRSSFRRIDFAHQPALADIGFERPVRRFPYVPNRAEQLDQDCYEAFNIQVQGLARRFKATSGTHLVIGVSGGLDSTHALIVAAKACDQLGLPRSTILGFTMPGFATGEETKGNAWALMNALGITGEEIDIKPAARQMLADMGHPFASRRAGLRHHLRECAGGAAHRLSLPPRQPARRLRRRHRQPFARSRWAGRPMASATR